MMTRLLAALAAATLATSTPWPRLDAALENYPAIHARETARLKAGQPAKFVLVVCYHGLGNRHHALVSAFALALARDAALFCPVPLTVRGTQALVSFAPLAFKLFCAARQNAVLRRSPFPSP